MLKTSILIIYKPTVILELTTQGWLLGTVDR